MAPVRYHHSLEFVRADELKTQVILLKTLRGIAARTKRYYGPRGPLTVQLRREMTGTPRSMR